MELRGEIRAQFALTPEEAAALLLAVGKTLASASARTESETEQKRLAQDTTINSAMERMQRAAKKLEEQAKAEAKAEVEAEEVKAECGAKDSAPEPAPTTQTEAPAQEQAQTSASASARIESAAQAQTQGQEPADAETPELAVSLLREQFGIPAVKEDRDEDQQRRSMELNRAVMAMIREITRNNSARSLADLKSDMEKKEFIRRSLTLAYDGQKFEEKPF